MTDDGPVLMFFGKAAPLDAGGPLPFENSRAPGAELERLDLAIVRLGPENRRLGRTGRAAAREVREHRRLLHFQERLHGLLERLDHPIGRARWLR